MGFLLKTDLKNIKLNRLTQILDGDETAFDQAAAEAEGIVYNAIFNHYDAQNILSRSGAERDATVIGWLKAICLYKLYERVPDEMVPERVVKNYDDTMSFLAKVSEGRVPVNLTRKTSPDGKKKTKFRWGSVKSRTH